MSPELPFNPFPGLRPFEPEEDHLFFGRETEIDELLRRLRTTRLLSVVGTSGSGKSSLIRSGLIPALYSGSMSRAGSSWRIAVFRPGEDPVGHLAAALARPELLGTDPQLAGTGTVLIEATLRRSTRGLVDSVRFARLPAHDNVLIVVDQFEELFRFRRNRRIENSRDEAIGFVKLLLEATSQTELPIYVVLTMRSDFIGDCMEYPGLAEAVNSGQYLVPRMGRDALRVAITGPVAVGGSTITPRFVTRLLNDIGDDRDQLPVLQHALMRTWERWRQRGEPDQPLDVGEYEDVGTLRQALSLHAEETFQACGSDRAKQIAERMFKALTDKFSDPRGVRRPTAISELAAICEASEAEVIDIVELFRHPQRSFLMPPATVPLTAQTIIDLSHESLMRCWDRLIAWAEQERTAAAFYVRLAQAAAWHAQGTGGLWAAPELDLALQWRRDTTPTEGWARRYGESFAEAMTFLDRSAAERDRLRAERERAHRKQLWQARVAAGVFAVLSIVAAYLAFQAVKQTRLAETNLTYARGAVEQTLASAEVDPAAAEADVPQMAEFRGELLGRAKKFYDDFFAANRQTEQLRADQATAYARLGDIDRMRNKPDEAVENYRRAIDQFIKLDREKPSVEYKHSLATTYHWLAETLRPFDDRVDAASVAYERALEIQTALATADSGNMQYRQELARTHSNRGILRDATKQSAAAEADFREAIRLLEPLAKQHRASAQDLARAYNNLANVVAKEDTRVPEAGDLYERAVQILERLLAEHPDNRQYRLELAQFMNNSAYLLAVQKRSQAARERSRQAHDLLDVLTRPTPQIGIEMADAHGLRGHILDITESPGAASEYEQSLQLFQRIGRDPSAVRLRKFHLRFGDLLLSLAARIQESRNDEGARRLLMHAVGWYLALPNQHPSQSETLAGTVIGNVSQWISEREFDERERRAIVAAHPQLRRPQ